MSSLKRKAGDQSAADAKKPKQQQGTLTSFFGAPKGAVAFDKEKWLAKLNPEQKRLLQLEIETLDDSWLAHLKDDITSSEFLELKRFLEREWQGSKPVFPPKKDIYSWCVLPAGWAPFSLPACPRAS